MKALALALGFKGMIVKSPKSKQDYEIVLRNNDEHEFQIFGKSTQADYPLAKKKHTLEYVRDVMHLRSRTNIISTAMRIRNSVWQATHRFFSDRGFVYIHTPIITSSDCEGAGELFHVTTESDKEDGNLYFKTPAFLTVSGQLNLETYWIGMGDVYTFSPTFRAENSHTKRHLSEFWMIEPEISYANLDDWINWAEDYLKYNVDYVLAHNTEDLEFWEKSIKKGIIQYLHSLSDAEILRLPYTEAIKILKSTPKSHKGFEVTPEYGVDLTTEHEKYLTSISHELSSNSCKTPIPLAIYDYPKDIKPFYMRVNDDNKTVAAMDILVPEIGEIIGGSQREERVHVLWDRMSEMGINQKDYEWYVDTRRYGSIPHSGFGVGLERLVMMLSGIENIRDTIPFPRWVGNAKF